MEVIHKKSPFRHGHAAVVWPPNQLPVQRWLGSIRISLLNRGMKQPSDHKFRFKNPLYSLDASAIDLSLKLFPWAAHRAANANAKLSPRA